MTPARRTRRPSADAPTAPVTVWVQLEDTVGEADIPDYGYVYVLATEERHNSDATQITAPSAEIEQVRADIADLQAAASRFVDARRVWEAAEQAWQARVREYGAGSGKRLGDLVAATEAVEQAAEDAERAARERERAAEQAVRDAELDAQFGPRQFIITSRTEGTGRRSRTIQTLHRSTCRFATQKWSPSVLRATGVQENLQQGDPVTTCGACKPLPALRAAAPGVADLLDARLEQARNSAQPVSAHGLRVALRGVSHAMAVFSSGDGHSGWSVQERWTSLRSGVKIVWQSPGLGEIPFPSGELATITAALLGRGYRIRLIPAEKRSWKNEIEYAAIEVARMTPVQAEAAAEIGPELLNAALEAGLSAGEAVDQARRGTLTREALAALTALRST